MSDINVSQPSNFEIRDYVRSAVDEIFDRNLYSVASTAPPGTLRGLDVLGIDEVRHKLSRAARIWVGARGRLPDFTAPQSFFEKLAISKFFAPIPMPSPADKLGCAAFIPAKLKGSVGVMPVVWSGSQALDAKTLAGLNLGAGSYYTKLNSGSGSNRRFTVPVSAEEQAEIEATTMEWMDYSHGEKAGEWWYGLIRPQILIEKDLAKPGTSLADWKFHTGNGRILAVQVDLDRHQGHRQLMFDQDFTYSPERLFFETGEPIAKPKSFESMIEVAQEIGRQFSFARIDLYLIDDRLHLGEITLAPMGGLKPPLSEKLDLDMGSRWKGGLFE